MNLDGMTSIPLTKDVVDSICCPVAMEPFEKATTVNCNGHHSFSLSTVTRQFGIIIKENQCAKPGPCPLCRGRVTFYYDNFALQSLVDAILGISKGQLHKDKMYAAIKRLKIEFEAGGKYPFARETFKVKDYRTEKFNLFACFEANANDFIDIKYFEIEISENFFRITIHLKSEAASSHLIGYFEANEHCSFESFSFDKKIIFFNGANFQFALKSLSLLIETNDFTENKTSNALANVIKFLESRVNSAT